MTEHGQHAPSKAAAQSAGDDIAATCLGVRVPRSPMLTDTRIERINAARYEGQEIAGALAVVKPGDRVLEMGAGLGIVGAVICTQRQPAALLSFEANPDLIPHIRQLYACNGLGPRARVVHRVLLAGPERPERVTFHVQSSYLGSSLTERAGRRSRAVSVKTAAFDAVVARFRPDVLVMDIEGGEEDILAHADLSGLRAVVLEFHPEIYGTERMQACKSALLRAGFHKLPGHCSRTVWALTREAPRIQTDASRPPAPEGGWSTSITDLTSAMVVPAPLKPPLSFPAGVLTASGACVDAAAVWRRQRRITLPPHPAPPAAQLEGCWLWGGLLYGHFGHFLCESTSRLWALPEVEDQVRGILFTAKFDPSQGPASYHRDFLSLMGTRLPLRIVDQPTRVARLLVPGQGFGLGAMAAGTDPFRHAMRARFAADVGAEGPEKLYISRSALGPGKGGLLFEKRLEQYLEAAGYTVFHPQQHDLRTQIAHYKAARQILAAEGSALHLLGLVARPDQQTGILLRRQSGATEALVTQLRAMSGRAPDVIPAISRSWMPEGGKRAHMGVGEIDFPGLQHRLEAAGYLSTQLAWSAIRPEEAEREIRSKPFWRKRNYQPV